MDILDSRVQHSKCERGRKRNCIYSSVSSSREEERRSISFVCEGGRKMHSFVCASERVLWCERSI